MLIEWAAAAADHLISGISRRTKFYGDGVGDAHYLARLTERIADARQSDPACIRIEWDRAERAAGYTVRNGRFESPCADILPGESRSARLQWIQPENDADDAPLVVHFAATGDEGFLPRRELLAAPLARAGVGSILLENPYYGARRPAGQVGYAVRTLADQFKMNEATIREGLSIVDWIRSEASASPGVTGVSMGGSMAATVGAYAKFPLAIAPCLAPFSPRPAFLEGVLCGAVDWNELARSYQGAEEIRSFVARTMDLVDLRQVPPPPQPSAAVLVGARFDAYVPAYTVQELHEHWAGSELRWLPAGHVSAALLHHAEFRRAIEDAFARLPARAAAAGIGG